MPEYETLAGMITMALIFFGISRTLRFYGEQRQDRQALDQLLQFLGIAPADLNNLGNERLAKITFLDSALSAKKHFLFSQGLKIVNQLLERGAITIETHGKAREFFEFCLTQIKLPTHLPDLQIETHDQEKAAQAQRWWAEFQHDLQQLYLHIQLAKRAQRFIKTH